MKSRGETGVKWNQEQVSCAHCGRWFGASILHAHSPKCWLNPEYIGRLRGEIPRGITSSAYERIASDNKWPSAARVRKTFGQWANFMLWLHQIDDAPDFAAIGAEVEKNRNILRDERGGLPVCERSRREWQVNGVTLEEWSLR